MLWQANISEEALAAAREMGREALVRRLAEIGMSEYDAAVYDTFLKPVEREVGVVGDPSLDQTNLTFSLRCFSEPSPSLTPLPLPSFRG